VVSGDRGVLICTVAAMLIVAGVAIWTLFTARPWW
jgi:hypothetical protein